MKREEKTALVEDLKARLGRASLALVSEYKGMTAGEAADVRRKLRAARGEMRVTKNTLVRRAIEGTDYAGLGEKLGGPVGLILSFEDPIEIAKTKIKDLTAANLAAAVNTVAGTARSMGIEIQD